MATRETQILQGVFFHRYILIMLINKVYFHVFVNPKVHVKELRAIYKEYVFILFISSIFIYNC